MRKTKDQNRRTCSFHAGILSFPKRIQVSSSSSFFFMSLSNRQSMRNSARQNHIHTILLPSRKVGAQSFVRFQLQFRSNSIQPCQRGTREKRVAHIGCLFRLFFLSDETRVRHTLQFFSAQCQFCCVSENNAAAPNSTFLQMPTAHTKQRLLERMGKEIPGKKIPKKYRIGTKCMVVQTKGTMPC